MSSQNIGDAQGYSDARGIHSGPAGGGPVLYAPLGVRRRLPRRRVLGNGVSELIVMALQALLDNGDEVLIPSPDYPLWTGAVSLCGGRAVHYRCDEADGWAARPGARRRADHRPNTRALVIINPNNPTGAVYSRRDPPRPARPGPAARPAGARRRDLRPDPLRRRDARARPPRWPRTSGRADPRRPVQDLPRWPVPVRLAGDLRARARSSPDYLEGLELLANMRLCPNVPAQYAIQTALGGDAEHRPPAAARRPAPRAARPRLAEDDRDPRA